MRTVGLGAHFFHPSCVRSFTPAWYWLETSQRSQTPAPASFAAGLGGVPGWPRWLSAHNVRLSWWRLTLCNNDGSLNMDTHIRKFVQNTAVQ